MLRLERIGKIYPTGEVLKDVNWEVKTGDRLGLVGVNGAGKTTQLRIVMGREEPTSGQIIRPASLKIAHLSQEFDVKLEQPVREEMWRAFAETNQIRHDLDRVQESMG
ncbi:MAG: ATP-binding cassette domain-containing protein, partial [Cyanobacteria bacterium J06639_1]